MISITLEGKHLNQSHHCLTERWRCKWLYYRFGSWLRARVKCLPGRQYGGSLIVAVMADAAAQQSVVQTMDDLSIQIPLGPWKRRDITVSCLVKIALTAMHFSDRSLSGLIYPS